MCCPPGPTPASILSIRRRPDCSPVDELRLGETLATIINAAGNVVHPANDTAHDGFMIPSDVSYRGSAPREPIVSVRADQRHVLRHPQLPLGKEVIGRMKEMDLIKQ